MFALLTPLIALVSHAAPADIDALIQSYVDQTPAAPLVSPKQLMAHPDWLIVDVRPENERAVSVLKGAITVNDFNARRADYQGRSVVAYCTVGLRSGKWVESEQKKGTHAFNLRGGLLAWTHAKGALVDASGEPTVNVHVYGRRWNRVAKGYHGVW